MDFSPIIELQLTSKGWHYSLTALSSQGDTRLVRDSARTYTTAGEAGNAAHARWLQLTHREILAHWSR